MKPPERVEAGKLPTGKFAILVWRDKESSTAFFSPVAPSSEMEREPSISEAIGMLEEVKYVLGMDGYTKAVAPAVTAMVRDELMRNS